MGVIELKEGNCQNCYKCIRGCPVKAIEFKGNRAGVIESDCILCGACIINCPQNAKFSVNQITKAAQLVHTGKVYASVAPSWSGYFGTDEFSKLSAALKRLGFAGVEETAIGAAETSRQYARLLEEATMPNIIVTACSSVVLLVERYYPELVQYLAPVYSPMMAHAKLMLQSYGEDSKVVFIGPCLAKKQEAADLLAGSCVSAVITFDELALWLGGESIALNECDSEACGMADPTARIYPVAGGILKTIPQESFGSYKRIAVDGYDRCIELFDAIREHKLTGFFIEANICAGSCIGGPIMRLAGKQPIITELAVHPQAQPHDINVAKSSTLQLEYPRRFALGRARAGMPTEEEIARILAKTGKYSKKDELNCGSCGYASCREKAIAVYQGKADVNMCLPYFRERAESISNTILEHSPNAIIAFDKDLLIQDLNTTAQDMFRLSKSAALGMPATLYIGLDSIEQAKRQNTPVVTREHYADIDVNGEQTVTYIDAHDMYVAFIKDITADVANEQALSKIRSDTVETAQRVINKQMRVAQEIASLLGETTAETKVALTKLKKTMERGD